MPRGARSCHRLPRDIRPGQEPGKSQAAGQGQQQFLIILASGSRGHCLGLNKPTPGRSFQGQEGQQRCGSSGDNGLRAFLCQEGAAQVQRAERQSKLHPQRGPENCFLMGKGQGTGPGNGSVENMARVRSIGPAGISCQSTHLGTFHRTNKCSPSKTGVKDLQDTENLLFP